MRRIHFVGSHSSRLYKDFLRGNIIYTKYKAPKPSEHPPSGEKISNDLGWNIGCRDKTLHYIKMISSCQSHRVNSTISGINPPLCCILTLITIQGHQNKYKEHHESRYTVYFD